MEVNIYVEWSLFHVTDIFVMVYHQVLPLAQGYLFSGKLWHRPGEPCLVHITWCNRIQPLLCSRKKLNDHGQIWDSRWVYWCKKVCKKDWWILQNISKHYSGNVVITLYRKHRGSLKLRNYKFLLTGITGSPFSCKVMVKEFESFQLARKWHYMYIVQFKTVINK